MLEFYKPQPSVGEQILKTGALVGFVAIAVFDQVRSIGQNVEADGIMDLARTVVIQDYNHWEQFKDYILPQTETSQSPTLTRNDDREPIFSLERDLDLGHAALGGSAFAISVYAKRRKRIR